MSRALDNNTAASLRSGNPLAAYDAISNALIPPCDGLLDIEILGTGHVLEEGQYVLQDGCAVGVSKPGLVQAFLVARKGLKDHMDGAESQTEGEMFAATAVILLLDPEYLTAANSRKRLLQGQVSSGGDARAMLEKEKRFVDSLLTSRLHRHTKSPTLWSHRRWLLTLTVSLGVPVDALRDMTDVVFVAGERHPRNYYAWCHARFLMGFRTGVNGNELLAATQTWCFRHHTDISGWSFLYFLLNTESTLGPGAACSTFTQVLDVVSSLRLGNESVWVFLRTLAASGLVGDAQYAQLLNVQKAVLETLETPADQAVLRAAINWCTAYRRNSAMDVAAVCTRVTCTWSQPESKNLVP
ncbi:hypothetical protein BT67DRAFT_255924 [Trichocladium antarcticum]|uniref:Uncharacterized protein n=1 Tax=Trichocladium antarcticum TaxID=1450529 RepID=A0AAN6UM67_9PEZI|nr:hypothetical protein BT67DRAFT_255924 [Trichocladium antarcticum]